MFPHRYRRPRPKAASISHILLLQQYMTGRHFLIRCDIGPRYPRLSLRCMIVGGPFAYLHGPIATSSELADHDLLGLICAPLRLNRLQDGSWWILGRPSSLISALR
jgi:hypothetical protein